MFNYFSDISLWWLLPIGILSVGLSYFYYYKPRTASDWTVKQLRQLFALRSIALFVVGLLLLGLLWESIRYRDEKPLFITMVDNSSSMQKKKPETLKPSISLVNKPTWQVVLNMCANCSLTATLVQLP
jgi:hypothetical protein